MNNKIKQEMQKIEIPKELHRRSELGVSQAIKELPKENRKLNVKALVMAAALFLSIGAFALLNSSLTGNDTTDSPNQPVVTEDGGVKIPAMQLPEEGTSADMIGLIVYNEKIYTQTGTEVNVKSAKNMLGEKLGTTKGTIDEWSKQEAYDEEFASTIGETDVYAVKGYEEDFRIMTYGKYEDGQIHSELYENLNGITVNSGEDFFAKLKMEGNISSATYRLFSDWNQDIEAHQPLENMEILNQFVVELNHTKPHPRNATSDPISDARNNEEFRELRISLKDGTTVRLVLLKDGFIYYGFMDAYFEMNNEIFDKMWSEIE